jgi:hypothetical protein
MKRRRGVSKMFEMNKQGRRVCPFEDQRKEKKKSKKEVKAKV